MKVQLMSDFEILFSVRLGPQHHLESKTRHLLGATLLPRATTLAIVKYPDDEGVYLFHLDEQGNEFSDTYHDSTGAAMDQAAWEYGVKVDEWKAQTH
jgi:hypothetical protein